MSMRRWGHGFQRRWNESWQAVRTYPRQVALIAAPWLLGLLAGIPLLWFELDRSVRAPAQKAGHDAVDFAAQSMLRWVIRLRDDTRFLADLTPRLAHDGSKTEAALVEIYASFLRAGRNYHKVRWIDEQGRERLRVDQDRGQVLRISTDHLQDKSGRPFFEHALPLQPGEVHLSPLDLNVENGRIERPIRPTLRASSPFRLAGGGTGVAVVNFHGEVLLERLREQAGHAGFDLYIVHPGGYWLMGPEPDDAWGWMLGHSDRTVARLDPRLWQAMQASPQGRWREWTFSSLQRAWNGRESDLLAHADPSLGQLRLLVRPHAPAGTRWRLVLAALAVASCAMLLYAVLAQARAFAREAAYTQRLRQANHDLGEANKRLNAAQQELARAERLSSLGLMVAGVAHEMNTPLASARLSLSTVRAGVATLERQVQAGLRRSDLEAFLASSHDACALADTELRRTSDLVQRFKQVAVDRASVERRRFELAEILLDADPRLRRGDHVDGVRLELALEPDVVMDTYPGPLEQVVSNLLANALLHGYPDGGPGRIRITARTDGPGHVRIEVSDEGSGIAADDLPRIFEPFFTTRRGRGGTGLGLHIVHQIVTEVLGGRIDVHSRTATAPDAGAPGTTFVMRIPRVGPDQPAPVP